MVRRYDMSGNLARHVVIPGLIMFGKIEWSNTIGVYGQIKAADQQYCHNQK